MQITVENVTKRIGKSTVIDHVSLTFQSGTVYGLCGYNGCGKTMLMRLIAGLIHPTEGKILFDSKALGKELDFPESMGLLIESPAFLGGLSGTQNLWQLASIKGKPDDEAIRRTIARVGLDPADSKKYRKYSLGMKQRLGIAAAVFESPALIILDEPTNALDADGVALTKQLIEEEKARGAIVLLTCHDHEFLYEVCDVVHTIEHGRIIKSEGSA